MTTLFADNEALHVTAGTACEQEKVITTNNRYLIHIWKLFFIIS